MPATAPMSAPVIIQTDANAQNAGASGAQVQVQAPSTASALPPLQVTDPSAASGGVSAAPQAAPVEDLSGRSLEWLREEADRSYQQGDYERAILLFQGVLKSGQVNGHLHYNLGNAYMRAGRLGPALQHYRIAEVYLPRDGDVEANLRFARDQRKEKSELPAPDALHRILFWSDALSPRELIIATLLLNVLFWGLLAVGRFRTAFNVKPLSALAAVATLLCGASAGLKHAHLADNPDAVVLEHEISARSGTDVRSVTLFTLKEGAEVKTQSVTPEWVQIDAGEGKRGWVERRFVGLIRGGEGG